MKKAIIIHCWDGFPEYCWYPQTKKELEKINFKVTVPIMPETNAPRLSRWLPKLQQLAPDPSSDLFLIGHSAGCITILRYLESLNDKQHVGGVIFVAGFTEDLGFEELKNFFDKPIDFEKIKLKTNFFIVINSDNDPYVPLKYGYILKEKLGAKLIIKHNMRHFSGPLDNEKSCRSLPDVVEEIKKII